MSELELSPHLKDREQSVGLAVVGAVRHMKVFAHDAAVLAALAAAGRGLLEGRTIVMVTHDPKAAARAKRSLKLGDGKTFSAGNGLRPALNGGD